MAGLYIHIPYCHSKCAYCDFFSRPQAKDTTDYRLLADALIKEYHARKSRYLGKDNRFATAYIGGGTPSILPLNILSDIVGAVRDDVANGGEFTIECNPEDIKTDVVKAWTDMGINRVSMGVQSLCDNELAAVGRRHKAADALRAVETLRQCGIRNMSLDLIYGLPEQTHESWKHSIDTLLTLRPEHLSAYSLSVESGTRLYARMLAGRFTPADDDTVAAMYEYLCNATAGAGYQHYEISNFALPGHEARHNSAYWRDEAYLGIGPSAVSFDGNNRRTTNIANIKRYLTNPTYAGETETESTTDRVNDAILIGLRTAAGLSLNHIAAVGGKDTVAEIMDSAKKHLATELLIAPDDQTLLIPEKHWLIADSVIRDLMQ